MDWRDGLVGKCFAICSKHGGLGFTLRNPKKNVRHDRVCLQSPQLWVWGRQADRSLGLACKPRLFDQP